MSEFEYNIRLSGLKKYGAKELHRHLSLLHGELEAQGLVVLSSEQSIDREEGYAHVRLKTVDLNPSLDGGNDQQRFQSILLNAYHRWGREGGEANAIKIGIVNKLELNGGGLIPLELRLDAVAIEKARASSGKCAGGSEGDESSDNTPPTGDMFEQDSRASDVGGAKDTRFSVSLLLESSLGTLLPALPTLELEVDLGDSGIGLNDLLPSEVLPEVEKQVFDQETQSLLITSLLEAITR